LQEEKEEIEQRVEDMGTKVEHYQEIVNKRVTP
jgi:hypothetical protein